MRYKLTIPSRFPSLGGRNNDRDLTDIATFQKMFKVGVITVSPARFLQNASDMCDVMGECVHGTDSNDIPKATKMKITDLSSALGVNIQLYGNNGGRKHANNWLTLVRDTDPEEPWFVVSAQDRVVLRARMSRREKKRLKVSRTARSNEARKKKRARDEVESDEDDQANLDNPDSEGRGGSGEDNLSVPDSDDSRVDNVRRRYHLDREYPFGQGVVVPEIPAVESAAMDRILNIKNTESRPYLHTKGRKGNGGRTSGWADLDSLKQTLWAEYGPDRGWMDDYGCKKSQEVEEEKDDDGVDAGDDEFEAGDDEVKASDNDPEQQQFESHHAATDIISISSTSMP
jgi:hypothetical protein